MKNTYMLNSLHLLLCYCIFIN